MEEQKIEVIEICEMLSALKLEQKHDRWQIKDDCYAKIQTFDKHHQIHRYAELNEKQKADLIEMVRSF